MKDMTKQERRYRRTESRILTAFAELLQKKRIQKITVQELSELADINRSTFYLHYSDVYDLLEKTEQHLIAQLRGALTDHWEGEYNSNHFFQFLERMYVILTENATLFSALMGENGNMSFLNTIEEILYDRTMETLCSFTSKKIEQRDLCHAVAFTLSGCMGMAIDWLQKGCVETPTHMAKISMRLLREGTASIGKPPNQTDE